MAITTIPWDDGSGDYITLTYPSASGEQTVVVSSDANSGSTSRTKTVTFNAFGVSPVVLTIVQEGVPEEYIVFADPAVEQICVAKWGDGVGLKPSQAAQVTTLDNAFQNKTNITSFDELQYFTGLTSLYQQFSGSTLQKVTLPAGIEFVNSNTYRRIFYNCTSLQDVDLSDFSRTGSGVTAQSNMFYNCSALTTVRFQSIEQMNGLVRSGTSSTTDMPFGYNTGAHYVYLNGVELKDLVIPSTITVINPGAFYRFNRLTSVTIHSSVTSIGSGAFDGCSGIVNMTVNAAIELNIRNTLGGSSNTSYIGDGTGTLYLAGNVSNANNPCYISFKKIVINGNYSKGSASITTNHKAEQLRIGGNYATTATGWNSIIAITSNALAFFEVMGTISAGYQGCVLGSDVATYMIDGLIEHLGYSGIACSPTLAGASYSRIHKIYVGDGTSAAHDNAILAQYAADSDWSAYTSKLDTWYNYVNDPDANQDYIN